MEIKQVLIKNIKVYLNNTKIHDSEQISKIANSIQQFGWDVPIVLNKKGIIIKGHGRFEAAKLLKLSHVPCVISDLSKEDEIASRIADNKVTEAPWDMQLLGAELESLQESDYNLELTGFNTIELGGILETVDPGTADEENPAEFKVIDESIKTDHKCPKCNYEWSGKQQ